MDQGQADRSGSQASTSIPICCASLAITTPNQVWGIDITYIRLRHGWMYLVAMLDWYSRYVVSWELDQTLEIDFVLAAVQRALAVAQPGIVNSDQGSHFTSRQYLALLQAAGAQISMDGKGRALDNVFTERLWRTVKYENVYLQDYGCSAGGARRDRNLSGVLQPAPTASGAGLPYAC